MNKHLFKGILIGVILSLLLTVSVSAIAQDNYGGSLIKVYHTVKSIQVDNQEMHLDVSPFIYHGRTYVPLRFVSEKLGCNVQWDNTTKSIAIYKQKLNLENEIVLSNGNYISGQHFKAGTYDIIAIKGGGNVHSSNYSGGINAIMGIADDGFYQKEYKNISLPVGVTLTVKNVTINLIFKD